ncbi:MAG: hypothetical protein Tsb009_07680 [Planctomycetaceae bacterium]
MESAESWRALFENWPEVIPREGMLVTKFNETISFVGYLISGGLLIVERDKPDTHGARKVIVPYEQICGVKLPTPMELARFQVMGFQAPM